MAVNEHLQALFVKRLRMWGWSDNVEYAGIQLVSLDNCIDACTFVLPQPEFCPTTDLDEMYEYMDNVAKKAANDFAAWASRCKATFAMIDRPKLCYYRGVAIVAFHRASATGGKKIFCYCDDLNCNPASDALMRVIHSGGKIH